MALTRIAEAFPGRQLTAVSALAEGADRLVVREILAHPGARLVVILPLAREDYMSDFESEESKAEFIELIERAREVIELGALPTRDYAYEAAGEQVVDRADVMVAIWDGKEAQGQGGTGTVVARARQRRLPLAWIRAANRSPGMTEPRSLGTDQGTVVFENFR